jgi:ABC-2 type transport system permease protein
MKRFLGLVENESLKMIRRKRFAIVMAILAVILSVSAYGHYRVLERRGDTDWQVEVQQRVARYQNMLRGGRVSESWARSLRAEVTRLEFHLERGINPERPTAPFFVRAFANIAGFLLLPLLVAVLASDIVSAESSEGTDKLLLTRGVRRWKVLLSKLVTLFLFTTLTLAGGALLAYLISSIVLDPRGWGAPTFSGFQLGEQGADLTAIRQLPLWQDMIVAYGLAWFAMLTVASIGLLFSVLFRSPAAAIGTMLATLIGGTIITRVSPDWTAGKYLFVSALPLADYYSGQAPPYDGMTLGFCVAVLAIWAGAAIVLSFIIFTRRDVFG